MVEDLIYSLVTFIVFLVAHWTIFYIGKFEHHRFRILQSIFIVFGFVYTALVIFLPRGWVGAGIEITYSSGRWISYLNGLIIYIFLFLSYGQIYYLTDRSISVRTFIELSKASDARLTLSELQKKYDHATLLGKRLEAMVYGKFLKKEGDFYKPTWKGLLAAKFFRLGRKILHSPQGY